MYLLWSFRCCIDWFGIVYNDFFLLLGFLKFFSDFSSVFWEFISNSWFISINYCFLSDFFGSFRFIQDLFWFSQSFLWILKILENFLGFMGLFGLYDMFLISFGFLCIFLGLFSAFELDFGSFIKTFFIVYLLFEIIYFSVPSRLILIVSLFGALKIDFDPL